MEMFKAFSGRLKVLGVLFFSALFVSDIQAELVSVYPEGSGPYGYWTSLVLDTNDSPHMVYRSGSTGGSLKYVRKVSGNWAGEEIESSFDNDGGHASLGLTSSGDPRVSYYKTGVGLRFASRTNSTWTLSTLDPEGGKFTSLKIDPSDKIHISYFSGNKLKYAKWDGVAWSTSVIDQGGIVGMWTSLALDQSQNPAISYYDSTNGDLKFAQWDGTNWSTQTVASGGDVGKYSSLAIDSNNRPMISFMKVSGGLQMAKWNGTSWDTETVYASGSEFTSLIIDGQGNPRIAFGEGSSLSLATFSGSVWSKTTVSSSENDYPSLAWSRAQEPHLTYGSYYFIYSVLYLMSPPPNVIGVAASSETIRWEWNDNSIGETGYRVINQRDLSPLSPDLPANTTGWVQTGLTPNTSSQIIVQVFNSTSSRNSSPSQTVYTFAVPPTNTQVDSVNANAVGLSWSRATNPLGTLFGVEKRAFGGNWEPFYSGSSTSTVATNLLAETDYSFRVKALNGNSQSSGYDSVVSTLTLASVPLAPVNLSVIALSSTSLQWQWSDKSNNEQGFRVIRSSDSLNLSGDLPANTTWWVQTGLTPNSPYNVRIEVFNVVGSTQSPPLPAPKYTLASTPGNLSIFQVFASSAVLTWDPNGNPPGTFIELYKADNNPSNYYYSYNFQSFVSSGVVYNLSPETTYYFKLITKNNNYLSSPFSNEASTRTSRAIPNIPGNPSILTRSASSLTWGWYDASNNENGFRVVDSSTGINLSGDLPANTTYWIQTGLAPATSYAVQIEVFNEIGFRRTSRSYSSFSQKEFTPYAVPTLTLLGVNGNTVSLSWENTSNPVGTSYDLLISTDNTLYSNVFVRTTSTQTVVQDLLPLSTYYFKARARHLTESVPAASGYSAVVSTTTPAGPPRSSSTPSAGNVQNNSIQWVWQDRANNEDGYRVLRSTDGFNLSGDLPANTTTWTFLSLSPNTPFQVKIQAYNSLGNGDSSDSPIVTTLANTPVDTTIVFSSGSNVTLSWSGNNNPFNTNYQLDRSLDGTNFFNAYLGTTTTQSFFQLSDLTTHYFRVAASNGSGALSPFDNIVFYYVPLQPPVPPTTPTLVSRTTATVTWSWSYFSNRADGFRVLNAQDQLPLSLNLPADRRNWTQTVRGPNDLAQIRVEAFNSAGSSFSPESNVVYSFAKPPIGTSLVSLTGRTAEIAWLSNGNSTWTVYSVDVSSNGLTYTHLSTTTLTSMILTNLTDDTTNYFRVRAQNNNALITAYDQPLPVFVPFQTPPPAPINISVLSRTGNSITWSWKDGSNKEDGFRVLDDVDSSELATLPANTTYWVQSGLTPVTKHRIQVEAFNQFGSARSSQIYTNSQEYTGHNPPTEILFSDVTPNNVKLSWSPNENPSGTYYRCYVSNSGGYPNELLTSDTTTLVIANLRQGINYDFKVTGPSGTETDGVIISTTIPFGAPSPVDIYGFNLLKTTSSINWVWKKSINATYYEIFRTADGMSLSGRLSGNTTYWVQTGLTPNSRQDVRFDVGNFYGSTVTYISASSRPNPPINTRVLGQTSTSIRVGWDLNGNPVRTYFEIKYSDDARFSSPKERMVFSGNEITLSNLSSYTTYYIKVRAEANDLNSYSDFDDPLVVYLQAGPPPAPTISRVNKSTSSLQWVWADTPNEDGYRVFRDSDNFNLSGDLPAGTTFFTLSGLSSGTSYPVYVEAFNSFGANRTASSEITYTNPPKATKTVEVRSSHVTLSWERNGNSDNTYYRVYGGTYPTSLALISYGEHETSRTISNLEMGTTYYFRAGSWTGQWSDPTVLDEPVVVFVPFGPPSAQTPNVDDNTPQSITWGWQPVKGVSGYRVHDKEGIKLVDLSANTTYFTKTGLTPYSPFAISLETYNDYGSTRSTLVYGYSAPNPVANLKVVKVNRTSVDLSWSTNGNPANVYYKIEKSTFAFYSYPDYDNIHWLDENEVSSTRVSDLIPGTTYFFRVSGSYFDPSDIVVSTVTSTLIAAPVVKKTTTEGMLWEWDYEDIEEVDHVRVFRSSDGADLSGLLPGTQKTWAQTGLTPNTQSDVYVVVESPNGIVASQPSGAKYTLPNPPKRFQIAGTGPGKVYLEWDTNGNPLGTEYFIQRSNDGNKPIHVYAGVGSSTTLTGLIPRVAYTLGLQAKGPGGTAEGTPSVKVILSEPLQFDTGGNGWVVETVDSEGNQGEHSALALDSQGNPHLFYRSDRDLKTAKRDSGQWFYETVLPNANVFTSMSIDVDTQDRFHLSYSNGQRLQALAIHEKTLVETKEVSMDSFVNGSLTTSINGQGFQGSSVKVRPNGKKVIAYGLHIPGTMTANKKSVYLFYEAVAPVARSAAAAQPEDGENVSFWEKSVITSLQLPNRSGSYSSGVGEISLALDAAGQSHVAYFHCVDREDFPNATGDIVYAHRVGDNWVKETVEEKVATEETSLTIALDPQDVVHILYHDNIKRRVRHATKNASGWKIETVEEGRGLFNAFASMDFDGTGRLHTVFLNVTDINENDDTLKTVLRYGQYSGGKWETQTIDSGIDVGFDPSLAVDSIGNVYVSYYDGQNGDMKFASKSDLIQELKRTVKKEGERLVLNGPRGQMVVNVLPGAFDQDVTLTIKAPDYIPVQQNPKNNHVPTGVVLSIEPSPYVPLLKPIQITMPFSRQDIKGININSLILAQYDESIGEWVPLVTRVDGSNYNLTATIEDWGLVQIMYQSVGASVEETVAFPNPLRPGRAGYETMTFDHLPLGAKIKIYSILGELVMELREEGNGQAHWDGRNSDGSNVASGVYFVRIEGEGGDKIIKVAVQR